jgi:thymidylate synthase (FAD)
MSVKLIWATPEGDDLIAYMARVSNPANQDNKETAPKLVKYLMDHQHWSPFEMVNACVEIDTTRDISRQILRHRSFSFQEFSGRYAVYEELAGNREARLQDDKNRQQSNPAPAELVDWFNSVQERVGTYAERAYKEALGRGVAKEQARVLLPEGLVPTRMYMNGTLRSWIHYWKVRCSADTQKEHRLIAEATRECVLSQFPIIRDVLENPGKLL